MSLLYIYKPVTSLPCVLSCSKVPSCFFYPCVFFVQTLLHPVCIDSFLPVCNTVPLCLLIIILALIADACRWGLQP